MSACEHCLLEEPSSARMTLEAFQEALASCDACPLIHGEAASPAIKLLVQKHREAARVIRRQRSDANKLRAELGEIGASAEKYEERVSRLEILHQASTRELEAQVELARRQEEALRDLSAPILRLSRGVIALPVIGRVDRARADVMMGKLLAELSERQVQYAILDLTGVEAIDAETADHLVRILASARLLGAEVVLTGLRGEVARTLVGLDFDPASVTTLASVEEALRRSTARPRT